jgi:hypothetical protein
MRVLFILFVTLFFCGNSFSQSVGIGTPTPDSSAVLELKSTSKGLLTPRINTMERLAIQNPANGLLVFDTNTSSFWYRNSATWIELASSNVADSHLVMGRENTVDSVYLLNCMLPTSIIDSSGFIVDDGGPNGNYSDNQDCGIVVQAPLNSNPIGVIIRV